MPIPLKAFTDSGRSRSLVPAEAVRCYACATRDLSGSGFSFLIDSGTAPVGGQWRSAAQLFGYRLSLLDSFEAPPERIAPVRLAPAFGALFVVFLHLSLHRV